MTSQGRTCLILALVAALIVAALIVGLGVLAALLWLPADTPSPSQPQAHAPQAMTAPQMLEPPTELPPQPRQWATPIDKPGLPNLHQVSEDLYRGAQPTAEGMRQLKAMGVRTVINLRKLHSDRDEIGDTGLAYEHIYFNP
ncbi:MAG: hypothetical protein ACODAJ_10005, partial [Planctomycetota bacterium]